MQYVVVAAGDVAALDILEKYLEPTYVKELPRRDAWGEDFRVEVSSDGSEYTVTSFGRDRAPDGPSIPPPAANGETTDFRNDIVFWTGSFVQYPRGIDPDPPRN